MKTKRQGYFQASMKTLNEIAKKTKDYNLVAGYLVLARHCTSESIGGRPPFTFSGAGQNSIKDKVHVSEARAAGVFDGLTKGGWVSAAANEMKALAPKAVRLEVLRGELDINLPHAITDGVGDADSVLARIKKMEVRHSRKELQSLTNDDIRLDALMLMLAIYANAQMELWGGVTPHFFHRKWLTHSKRKNNGSHQWMCEPETQLVYTAKMNSAMQHTDASPLNKERFWNALGNLTDARLIYEAVTWATADFEKFKDASAICTIRVNDYHADSGAKGAAPDPSLLKEIGDLGFYVNPINDRDEPEQMKVHMSSDEGLIVGIYRPRFRTINPDTGLWLERERDACAAHAALVLRQAKNQ